MSITSLTGIGASQQQQNIQRSSARLQAAIAELVSGKRSAASDVASFSIATQLQSEVSSLKQASGNLAQAASLAQVADGAAEQIGNALERMRDLGQKASSPTLNAETRKQINQEFQELSKEIDRLAETTNFNGQKLLDGSLSGNGALSLTKLLGASDAIDSNALAVDGISSSALFNGQSLNLSTAEGASSAVAVVGDALNKITSVRATLGSFQETVGFAAANIDSAVANQEAARSILQDADFIDSANDSVLASLQYNAGIALKAQTNNLSPNLLKLLVS